MSDQVTTDRATTGQEPTPFDVTGPLPTGTVLLEASAGTGKTWTIGALVTRMVAEGHADLDEMLVVTFGRAASQELRERVRDQLVEAERVLAGGEVDGEPTSLVAMLRGWSPERRHEGRARVVAALTAFDAATIVTTHQFCSMVLDSLGVAGDTDSRAELVEDLDDLRADAVDDLYLRAFAHADSEPPFSHGDAVAIARDVVEDPQARIEPVDAEPGSVWRRKADFARAVRDEVERRKRRAGLLSYDDLLSRLADALADPDGAARQRMRRRWHVVLVDEFQDTDPVQWRVLDRAFSGHATMVLIGDPKQAIYAFRGGDLATYLAAAGTAVQRQTLAVNRRSDAALLERLDVLLGGAELGDPEVVVRPVAAHHAVPRLLVPDDHGVPAPARPLRLRALRRQDLGVGPAKALLKAPVQTHVHRDLALDVRRLLTSGATWDGDALLPRHVAVIAHAHRDLAKIRDELGELGVPAVVAGGGSIFTTPAATEWLTLLEALEQPHRAPRVRAAALTSFVGWTATELVAGGDDATDEVAELLRGWLEVARVRGIAAVLEAATAAGLPARVLGQVGGERRLTDLRHLGEVLHEVATTERLGVVALLTWLRESVAEAGRTGSRLSERTRRLDSDAAAVQLVTVHASKGLQYPVVYLPTLADRYVREPERVLFHDAGGDRCRNVAGGGPGWADDKRRGLAEDAGESLRLLYVAMTRAQSQVVCWWAPTRNAVASPLHRLLMREPGSTAVPDDPPLPKDDAVVELFGRWSARGGPAPELAQHAEAGPPPARHPGPGLTARRFTRSVDHTWRRSSYSSLSSAAAEQAASLVTAVGSEPEMPARDDEALPTPGSAGSGGAPSVPPDADLVSPMADLPVGATFGSLVHAVLEHADPAALDWRGELAAHVSEQLRRWPVDLDPDTLVDALVAVADSPLGPLNGDLTLRAVPLDRRLVEMDFELPLAGGEHPTGREVHLADLADLLQAHLRPDDPVAGYADTLRGPLGEQPLRGYLTGSVDLVLRAAGEGPFLVVDYKTNWLGPFDETLTASRYDPGALAGAMTHSDYPLQALLYAVVLHRFLRWRLADYDPDRDLGGVLYLYLRGMCGPTTPVVDGHPCGVFSWRPPSALVDAISDLLDGARP